MFKVCKILVDFLLISNTFGSIYVKFWSFPTILIEFSLVTIKIELLLVKFWLELVYFRLFWLDMGRVLLVEVKFSFFIKFIFIIFYLLILLLINLILIILLFCCGGT